MSFELGRISELVGGGSNVSLMVKWSYYRCHRWSCRMTSPAELNLYGLCSFDRGTFLCVGQVGCSHVAMLFF